MSTFFFSTRQVQASEDFTRVMLIWRWRHFAFNARLLALLGLSSRLVRLNIRDRIYLYPAMFTAIKLIQRLSPGSRDRGSAVRHHHHQPRSGSSTSNQSLCSHAAESLINLRHRVPNMSRWGFPSARTRLEYLIFEIIDLVVPSQFVSFWD